MSGHGIQGARLPAGQPAAAGRESAPDAPARPGWVEFAGLAMISFALSGVMAACMTLFAVGLTPGYPTAVAFGWGLGFVVSLPAAIVIVPPVVKWQMRQNARIARRKAAIR